MSNPGPNQTITSNLIEENVPQSDGWQAGSSATSLLGFWGATPVVQRSGAAQAAVVTTAATQTSPFGYATLGQANAIVTLVNELRAAMVLYGLIKGS